MLSQIVNSSVLRGASGFVRPFASATVVKYSSFGRPEEVLKVEKDNVPDNVGASDVLVEMIHAPIHPVDINLAEGTYGIRPKLPSVAGTEGVGIVKKVGSSVQGLKPNDYVVPVISSSIAGTWRTQGVFGEKQLQKVPSDIPTEYLSAVSINPCTALRLLDDYVQLKSGDVIIQNAASSMVGLSVIQIAKSRGVKTINVIRRGPDFDDQVQRLKGLGGDIVVDEDYVRSPEFQRLISDLPRPRLALNAVGGDSATELARVLGDNGHLVTYGGMSRRPVTIPTSHLVFRNITSHGFWLTKWLETHSQQERQAMFDTVFSLIRNKQLKLWLEKHKFSDFQGALARSQEPAKGRKIILDLQL
ncbi:trans-2-enoyl-CoA reductase [Heterostelium album PN500]|uniref:enoyl-[acyl-carrier-protein] reductase n=1 Tax=Heterostelium pallidum (strain ATCC 26659 / Pp 5 / PN500) TaxID=670386 RepID=D3BNI9_HETP5|nr:trans-2-enoyl-CoA reductase [Heterostelium album PN500]EFA76940.1 trans-2-enoyl-CoA reductase [Heterostelium album PN500]|eukprot:XP_020429072.1 trans-2-enoyl-CoA reductase [Heterostelium album PN500]